MPVGKEELASDQVATKNVFGLREIDFELPRKAPSFNLSGIVYDQDRPLAIINNRVVEQGALISGAELMEIQPNYVKLLHQEKEITLKVK